jgi:hypothetical protein
MDRLSFGTVAVLPVDLGRRSPSPGTEQGSGTNAALVAASEAEVLATAIERAVLRETSRGVRGLRVEVLRHGIVLVGRCSSYYIKQKAQHAAMGFCRSGRQLSNGIEVT